MIRKRLFYSRRSKQTQPKTRKLHKRKGLLLLWPLKWLKWKQMPKLKKKPKQKPKQPLIRSNRKKMQLRLPLLLRKRNSRRKGLPKRKLPLQLLQRVLKVCYPLISFTFNDVEYFL